MKKKKSEFILLNEQDCVLGMKKAVELEFNEEYVISVSKQKYGTDEPCIIYRTCIVNEVISQLDDFVLRCKSEKKDVINIEELPDEIMRAISFNSEVSRLKIVI